MILPMDAPLLAALSVRVNVDWPRFIVSMAIFAGMVGFLIYLRVRK